VRIFFSFVLMVVSALMVSAQADPEKPSCVPATIGAAYAAQSVVSLADVSCVEQPEHAPGASLLAAFPEDAEPQHEERPSSAPSEGPQSQPENDPVAVFPRHHWNRFWISGQINIIEQGHGGFPALYSGPHSLHATAEHAASRIFTLYTAVRLSQSADVVFDVEEASGNGISNAVGLAGFTNVDVVRVPGEGSPLSTAPYVARAMFRYVVPLSSKREEVEAGPMGTLTSLSPRRVEFRIGKFALPDFLDVNAVGSDSHLQFMNWTVVNNGAWDFAADTRGYTYGALLELDNPGWSLRFVEALMPKVANGIDLQWNLSQSHAHNLELELRPQLLANRRTRIRVLGYRNIADMGNYAQAIADFRAGLTPAPDIIATRQPGRSKDGVGLNAEQELTAWLRAFVRLGWNDGHNESFAYTEVDRTVSFGGDLAGEIWHRKHDKIGAAFVSNGISPQHAQYLALGGLGFILGDGALTYGRENIFESYYTAHIWRGVFAALDLQHINNPGYNQVRGPLWVEAGRVHVDF
jgi:high affinity Mn2+ porin